MNSTPYQFVLDAKGPVDELEDGSWVEVSGGGLPVSIRINVLRTAGGRFGVRTMILGEGTTTHISSEVLRKIPVREILTELFQDFSVEKPDTAFVDPDAKAAWESGLVDQFWFEQFEDAIPEHLSQRDREFAEVFMEEYARDARRATSRTAARLHVSRPTAHRRAKQLGLIPRSDR